MSSLEDGKIGEQKYTPPKIANPAPLGIYINFLKNINP